MSPLRCPPPPTLPDPLGPDEELARLARALAHPARVRIVRYLREREECLCGELCDELPLAQSTVSQHLKVLREAGLVHGSPDGTRVCYCVHPEALDRIRRLIDELCAAESLGAVC